MVKDRATKEMYTLAMNDAHMNSFGSIWEAFGDQTLTDFYFTTGPLLGIWEGSGTDLDCSDTSWSYFEVV